jgi:competence protein ComEC
MLRPALAVLAGALALLPWAALPDPRLPLLVGLIALLLRRFAPAPCDVVALALLMFAWSDWRAAAALAERLPVTLEGLDLTVQGEVSGLPRRGADATRLDFRIDQTLDPDGAPLPWRGTARLSDYALDRDWPPGSRATLVVRLRRPRGALDPGSFDLEAHALAQRIAALGSVRRVLANDRTPRGVDALRFRFSRWLSGSGEEADRSARALLGALAVGDQGALAADDWDHFRLTGTAHLVAISGFHIGMVAVLGVLLVRLAYRGLPRLALAVPRRQAEAAAALTVALGYAGLAGWSLPVARTVAMIAVLALARLARRHVALVDSLAAALVVVLIGDPLAVLAPGFWLSFVGVGWLLFCFADRWREESLLAGYGRAQWVSSVGLAPIAAAWFNQMTWVGPAANLVAIPLISLLLAPLAIALFALWALLPTLAAWLLPVATGLARLVLGLQAAMATWPGAATVLAAPSAGVVMLALLGALVLLLPRAVPGRALGLLLFLPLFIPSLPRVPAGQLQVVVIDVGQGLAVLLRTASHALLFDTGPAFPGGLDLGESAVVPAAHALGVRHLDRLVLSHGDRDHAGGAAAVIAALSPARVQQGGGKSPYARCVAGERWRWDGVDFEFLHPPEHFPDRGNDSSCILRVAVGSHAVLLPGDASALIEARLLREQPGRLGADLLIAPHHGSRSASSEPFLDAVSPRLVAVSAGYRNRFNHPAPEVLAHYHDRGIDVVSTVEGGMTEISVTTDGVAVVGRWRRDHPRFWTER